MKRLLMIAFLIAAYNFLCAQQFPSSGKDEKLSYKIIPSANHTWGYEISNGTKLFIRQPTIPAIPGNKGFVSKQSAEKVAKAVIEKIRKGESPPTITIDEMKKLDVVNN